MIVVAVLALAFTVMLVVIIRDVPRISTMAADVVAVIAVDEGVPPGEAAVLSELVVDHVEETLLGGSLNAADDVRTIVMLLPLAPLLVVLVVWAMTPRGWIRRRAVGLTIGWFGVALVAYTWLLSIGASNAADELSVRAQAVAARFVSEVLGPAWTIGWITLIAGIGIYVWARMEPASG